MKNHILSKFLFLIICTLLLPGIGQAREIAAVVSTKWLQANLNNPKLIVLDIRRLEDYYESHIPGAISAFYGAWAYQKDGLFAQLPELDDLNDTIGYVGITLNSWVVVAGKMDTPRLSYQSGRVACTLQYAGIENVALLDGGINKWIVEKRPLSTEPVRGKEKPFQGTYKKEVFADKEYIKSRLGKVLLLDVREPEYFTGKKKMDCVPATGRIPGAFNMPTSCAFKADKTFKKKGELAAIVEAVAGNDRSREIVTYCDIGQCCPTWSYLLREILGYTNVRLYLGSMQEWMQDPGAPVTR